jgi:hypothetical protein
MTAKGNEDDTYGYLRNRTEIYADEYEWMNGDDIL